MDPLERVIRPCKKGENSMKKLMAIGLTLVLVLTLGLVATVSVGATDAVFDNWKGVLQGRDRTIESHYYGDAEGHVILNYRKGQQDYIVNLVAEGLKPGEQYEVKFYIGNAGSPELVKQHVGYLTADSEGEGHLNVRGFKPEIVEFDEFGTPPRFLVMRGAWRVLTTHGDAVEGGGEDLEPVGSNRGE